jgi:RNA polymerase sigma factor (TIGR02999 family)
MRRILIDKGRRKRTLRHGGGQQRVGLEELELAAPGADDQLLAVAEALDRLAAQHPVQAQVVKLGYFAGLTIQETAEVLGVCADTVKDYSAHARAWLYREMRRRGT